MCDASGYAVGIALEHAQPQGVNSTTELTACNEN